MKNEPDEERGERERERERERSGQKLRNETLHKSSRAKMLDAKRETRVDDAHVFGSGASVAVMRQEISSQT